MEPLRSAVVYSEPQLVVLDEWEDFAIAVGGVANNALPYCAFNAKTGFHSKTVAVKMADASVAECILPTADSGGVASMRMYGSFGCVVTATGKIADSARIGRNVSTVAFLQAKTPQEIEADGEECGNTKLRVGINRNGRQHSDSEYIDLKFTGNLIRYDSAKQHTEEMPF